MLRRVACLCALALPLGGCFSYTEHPAAPASVVVVPPAQQAPAQQVPGQPAPGTPDPNAYVR